MRQDCDHALPPPLEGRRNAFEALRFPWISPPLSASPYPSTLLHTEYAVVPFPDALAGTA
jgi:hypothetical protein